jgi:hypothetical protein
MHTAKLPCLRINCPEWYERLDFLRWLKDGADEGLARWWQPGRHTNDYADVFMTYDHGEGSDKLGLPDDIWEEVCRLCDEAGLERGVIWLCNVE